MNKILIKNAVNRKEGYLYYILNTDLCMSKFGDIVSDKKYKLEVRRAKYYFKKNASKSSKENKK